jgi:hypothetical protein
MHRKIGDFLGGIVRWNFFQPYLELNPRSVPKIWIFISFHLFFLDKINVFPFVMVLSGKITFFSFSFEPHMLLMLFFPLLKLDRFVLLQYRNKLLLNFMIALLSVPLISQEYMWPFPDNSTLETT